MEKQPNPAEEIENAFDEMASVLAYVRDKKLIKDFLMCLLTENEMDEIIARWALVKLIDRGMSQRRIASELGLSLCKITRGSKELKKRNSAFKRFIDLAQTPEVTD
ncbi:MAG: Trp family transcriptional regulator [Spirochaetia bacterium]